jgi:hypothetical protein
MTAVGVFDDRHHAEEAIEDLKRHGFRDDQIGFAFHGDQRNMGREHHDEGSAAGEGAVGGLLAGAGIGGLIAAAASVFIPGVGPILAGGILASALAGAAVGAVAGGILGALVGMGVPEEEARYYEGEFHSGRPVVTVGAGDRYAEAMDIMRRHGGHDYESRNMAGTAAGMSGSRMSSPAPSMMGSSIAPSSTPIHPWNEVSGSMQQRWQGRVGSTGGRWEDHEPWYRYGHDMAHEPRYRNMQWSEAEPQLRSGLQEWVILYGYTMSDGDWDRWRDSVHEGWDEGRTHVQAA